MSYKPLDSIDLPVFKGENYFAEALDSLLAQTLSDFELIISDYGSIDSIESICRSYAAKDNRVQYERTNKNMGWQ